MPGSSGGIAVQILILGNVVRLLDSGDNPISYKRFKAAVMSIVWSTDKGKFVVCPVLVPVYLFPTRIRIKS